MKEKYDNSVYSVDNPYTLRWRFDFDESLMSICNINDDGYDTGNLSEEDRETIELMYGGFRNLKTFVETHVAPLTPECADRLLKDGGAAYIDYVCTGYPNPDGKTYHAVEFWETENNIKTEACSYDSDFDRNGCFVFEECSAFPCHSRTFENGELVYDFRTADGRSLEEEQEEEHER